MDSVEAVEKIVNYSFTNKSLLMAALTYNSSISIESPSFERLQFIGAMALRLAVTNYIYLSNPNLQPKGLCELREANTNKDKLARVAVKHNLYKFFKHDRKSDTKIKAFLDALANEEDDPISHYLVGFASELREKHIKGFLDALSNEEDDPSSYSGFLNAPRILSCLIDSIAGAVYIDVNFDVPKLWEICKAIFEPMYTMDDLQRRQQPEPLLTLSRVGEKLGKRIDIRYFDCGDSFTRARVYLDDECIARGQRSKCRDLAKLNAAKTALWKLSESSVGRKIDDADKKLIEVCNKRKSPNPIHSVENGGDSGNGSVCLAKIETPNEEGTKRRRLRKKLKTSQTLT